MKKNYHIFGANSHIAKEFVNLLAASLSSKDSIIYAYSKNKPDYINSAIQWVEFDALKFDYDKLEILFSQCSSIAGPIKSCLLLFHSLYENPELVVKNSMRLSDIQFINFTSHQLLIEGAAKYFCEGSSILSIGSVASRIPGVSETTYGPLKAALSNFIKAIKYKCLERGIGITDVVLGAVKTPMTQGRPNYNSLINSEEVADILLKLVHNYETMNIDEITISRAKK